MFRTVEIPIVRIEIVEAKLRALEWAMDIIRYIDANEVPNDRWEARKTTSCIEGGTSHPS